MKIQNWELANCEFVKLWIRQIMWWTPKLISLVLNSVCQQGRQSQRHIHSFFWICGHRSENSKLGNCGFVKLCDELKIFASTLIYFNKDSNHSSRNDIYTYFFTFLDLWAKEWKFEIRKLWICQIMWWIENLCKYI